MGIAGSDSDGVGNERLTGFDVPMWPDTRTPTESRHIRRWIARGVLTLASFAVLVLVLGAALRSGAVGGSSTVVQIPQGFPSEPSATPIGSAFFYEQCSNQPVGVVLHLRSGFVAFTTGEGPNKPLPAGHALKIERRWIFGTRYIFIENDGRGIALHPGPWVAISCP